MDQNERIAKLEATLEVVASSTLRMEQKLDTWATNFVTRIELAEMIKSRDEKIKKLEDEKTTNKTIWPGWVAAAISLVALLVTVWPK